MKDGDAIEEEEAPGIFESALTELLAAGVTADVRALVQKFEDDPSHLVEVCGRLPTTVLEPLPKFDVERDCRRALRNPALSEALRWRSLHFLTSTR